MKRSFSERLDRLTIPLVESRLIEASAGTGKTYTIADLYLRLLLGIREQQSHAQLLTVDQILVVTFTNAAKGELKERIAKRIHQCRLYFHSLLHRATECRSEENHSISEQIDLDNQEQSLEEPFFDQLIDYLLSSHDSESDEREQQSKLINTLTLASTILLNAEQQMDSASIYTIHGFCQRMLQQFAIDSGQPITDLHFIEDETEIKKMAIRDYWRTFIYHQPDKIQLDFNAISGSPDKLLAQFNSWFNHPYLTIRPEYDLEELIEKQKALLRQNFDHTLSQKKEAPPFLFHDYLSALVAQIKREWREHADQIRELMHNIKQSQHHDSWFNQVNQWVNYSEGNVAPDPIVRFGQSALLLATKKNCDVPQLPLFTLIDAFVEQRDAFKVLSIKHCYSWVSQRIIQLKQNRSQLSFQDIIDSFSDALEKDFQGDQALLTELRQQFPMALIDEFQDTDPLQYKIFDLIYQQPTDTSSSLGLLMIGDPKQAIYSFRGGDIFTYKKAKKNTPHHYSLDTNWRSSAAMVFATNALFGFHQDPFLDGDIPFQPVQSKPEANKIYWERNNTPQPALIFWNDDQGESSKMYSSQVEHYSHIANKTANEVKKLLLEGEKGICKLHTPEGDRPIQAKDITLLVNSRKQADKLRASLTNEGVASVYLSERNSVFTTKEASELAYWLHAILDFANDSKVKTALATASMGITLEEIKTIQSNDTLWLALLIELQSYKEQWLHHGILAMLRHFITARKIHASVLSKPYNGERILTNLHLGELLLGELLQKANNLRTSMRFFIGCVGRLNQQIPRTHNFV